MTEPIINPALSELAERVRRLGIDRFGFNAVGIAGIELATHEAHLQRWLAQGFHGEMGWMASHGDKRSHPEQLLPGTVRVISVRLDHLPPDTQPLRILNDPERAYISRYALGRDYHKLMRPRLEKFARAIAELTGPLGYRAFVDSAPVLEKALAEKAGLGWIGKHTVLINRHAGSWFFLGEILIDAPLPVDHEVSAHCGSCTACIDICPTQAIVGPQQLDARRCISYLTIELRGSIPEELRPLLGNRVFGCDDCQLICPWNRYAKASAESDFQPRHGLDDARLVDLFLWDEATFLQRTEGSPIRRTGYVGWLRNLAVGLGNIPDRPVLSAARTQARAALQQRLGHESELVREHVQWALQRLGE